MFSNKFWLKKIQKVELHIQSTAGADHLAGDVGTHFAGEKKSNVCHFLCAAKAAQRYLIQK